MTLRPARQPQPEPRGKVVELRPRPERPGERVVSPAVKRFLDYLADEILHDAGVKR